MDLYTAEKILFLFYGNILLFSGIASISSAVIWVHWKYVLDACPETNCGCFLYGLSTRSSYQGGHIAYCHYATYGLIIPIIFAIIFCCYHGYRVCMKTGKRRTGTTMLRQSKGDIVVISAQSEISENNLPMQYWIVTSVISSIMIIYTLVYASIYTDGYSNSCYESRNEVIKYLSAHGNALGALKNRLTCGSIFDFMDYLHQDTATGRVRTDRINSALCFYFALFSSWLSVFSWIVITSVNIIFTRRTNQTNV